MAALWRKWYIYLSLGVFISGILCVWHYRVPNGIESYTFKYLFPPFLILTFYLGIKKYKDRKEGELVRLFAFLVIAYFSYLAASGHVLWINHLVGQSEMIVLEGEIVYKDSRGGGVRNRFVVVKQFDGDEEYKIGNLSKSTYMKYELGDTYSGKWQKGSLGIIYRF